MAKSVKKSGKKMAKKASGRGSEGAKARKAIKAKASSKKVIAKPVKKTAPKVVAKIEVIKKVASKPALTKREIAAAAPKPQHNLNIFPALTQRPIAHKSKTAVANDDKTRYSDDELREFEVLIKGKLENSREEFKILKETLNRNNDAGTDSTSGGNTKVLEDGAETAEKENLSQLAARQLKYITNLENALVRIKNRTYGICTVTGKLIPKERLIAVPHTTQSIEAKMMQHD